MNSLLENYSIEGKTALITGAGGLLGSEHAAALLDIGATVVLTDVSADLLSTTKDNLLRNTDASRVITQIMDVTNTENIHSVADNLIERGKRVDILVNNAAIDPKVKENMELLESSRLENYSIEQWNIQLAVGLTGAFLCSQVFGSAMARDKQGGVILNIASDLSVFSPDQRLYRKDGVSEELQPVKPVTYSVIKTGLIGLTRYLATYWADKNIRANALSPGGVFNGQGDDFVQRLTSLIPLGRMAERDEYRSAIQFLCSDASKYMNGQNIVMDGGRSVL